MKPDLDWFSRYCRLVLWPALYFYCEHGAIFEPHLQNTLVRCREGKPVHAYFRDLEGTKLLAERWADRVPAELAGALLYDEEQAWRRFVYCVIFNQLAEVIDCLPGIPCQELWQEVRRSLAEFLVRHGSASSRAMVARLREERQLPVKANLITRFLQARDRDAAYVGVANPLR
jgi:siderophore synthetase component